MSVCKYRVLQQIPINYSDIHKSGIRLRCQHSEWFDDYFVRTVNQRCRSFNIHDLDITRLCKLLKISPTVVRRPVPSHPRIIVPSHDWYNAVVSKRNQRATGTTLIPVVRIPSVCILLPVLFKDSKLK
ncbi:hypothetical protein NPIL_156591 [Nephila pilipes]|uniref:Uncharacterized protein n=1 Tax=Nephila pilipes TaxID=299642 RepID=A0A8X6MYD3_NEPPI|nr:hypothetical protein NPIL_156591 [Nephila pilipes]